MVESDWSDSRVRLKRWLSGTYVIVEWDRSGHEVGLE